MLGVDVGDCRRRRGNCILLFTWSSLIYLSKRNTGSKSAGTKIGCSPESVHWLMHQALSLIAMSLHQSELPLQSGAPPAGSGWDRHSESSSGSESVQSSTITFNTALKQRDTFLGKPGCVICGNCIANCCYIISEPATVSQSPS